MSEVKLLPLPQWTQYNAHLKIRANSLQRRIQDYARANMEPLIAENERLRAEVAEYANMVQGYIDTIAEADAQAERLAEAAKGVLAHVEGQQPISGWLRDNDASRTALTELRAALDQEGGNG